jgi:hypothetical protein
MAARLNPVAPDEIVDLRLVTAAELDPVFEEEVAVWRDELEWDFAKSAQPGAPLRRRARLKRARSGGRRPRSPATSISSSRITRPSSAICTSCATCAAQEREDLLLRSALDEIFATPHITRMEAQLLMLDYAPGRVLPRAAETHSSAATFMLADLNEADLGEGKVRRPFYLENWSDRYSDAAANLIAEAYAGHVDGWINDQYRSPAGAHRFLHNIVAYPGCGTFSQAASYLAFEGGQRPVVRPLAGQPGLARIRPHHPDLRVAHRARNRYRPCPAAPVAAGLAQDGMPLRRPHRHRGQRRRGGASPYA